LISVALLVGSGCGSDAENSRYPQPQDGQATSQSLTTTGSTTGSGMGGQSNAGNGTIGAPTTTAPGTTSGQTNSISEATGGQVSTNSGATGGQANIDTESTGQATTPPLSFATDIWPVWSMARDPVFVYRGGDSYSGCTDEGVCHGGGNPGAGLRMPDQQTAYAQMIDTPSVSSICAGTQRLVVGDPENSCLILFYQGRLGNDDLVWVDDAEIELMREWIRQGALP
jgi:hypothetical protein